MQGVRKTELNWKKAVHPRHQGFRHICSTVNRRFSLENNNLVGKVCRHDKVMLNNKSCFLLMKDKPFDDLWCKKALLWIKMGTWFIGKYQQPANTKKKKSQRSLKNIHWMADIFMLIYDFLGILRTLTLLQVWYINIYFSTRIWLQYLKIQVVL
jgi:hypothetical protein